MLDKRTSKWKKQNFVIEIQNLVANFLSNIKFLNLVILNYKICTLILSIMLTLLIIFVLLIKLYFKFVTYFNSSIIIIVMNND